MRRSLQTAPMLLLAAAALLPVRAHAQRDVVEGQTTITLPDTSSYSRTARRILAIERDRSGAIARHDTAGLANIYAEDFHGVLANGRRVDRDALFAIFLAGDPAARFRIDELEVREFGGTVLVTGRLRTLGPGGEVAGESRYLHVYLRRELRWWIVAAEGTAVMSPSPQGP